MKLKLTITCDNEAFAELQGAEAARILRRFADEISDRDLLPGENRILRDINGNCVGEAKVTR